MIRTLMIIAALTVACKQVKTEASQHNTGSIVPKDQAYKMQVQDTAKLVELTYRLNKRIEVMNQKFTRNNIPDSVDFKFPLSGIPSITFFFTDTSHLSNPILYHDKFYPKACTYMGFVKEFIVYDVPQYGLEVKYRDPNCREYCYSHNSDEKGCFVHLSWLLGN